MAKPFTMSDDKLVKIIETDVQNKKFGDAGDKADLLERNHADDILNVWISMLIDDLTAQNQKKSLKDVATIKSKLAKK
ncbi:hypothetical protein [Acetilactobacillus jinshanensis]|uniref:Uncharacterized protein n=1 Tax=Acetilactobacillus jinshanensis TaxID=1720083 RepID=A0A4P6ZJZ7_9LACO|nr:hypothetical protein [Acetilactobacillus jinshanensis]QBP18081.1 hypothetical protein ELX58_02750 [Acetilactobacillus jinshanensis]